MEIDRLPVFTALMELQNYRWARDWPEITTKNGNSNWWRNYDKLFKKRPLNVG